jgi:hypothetical protein
VKNKRPTVAELEAILAQPDEDRAAPPPTSGRMSISEMERLMQTEGEDCIEILPDGSVRRKEGQEERKPLMFREQIVSDY